MGKRIHEVSANISIVVPLGPSVAYLDYLVECLTSIGSQMQECDELILIDDMLHLDTRQLKDLDLFILKEVGKFNLGDKRVVFRYIKNDWLYGCATSWNRGVSLASNELVLLMGSDDKLYPGALDVLRRTYYKNKQRDGWYNFTVELQDGTRMDLFNNAAAITKGLWKKTGGFPVSAGIGAPDALLISIMMVHMPECLIQVERGKPYYWVRQHEAQDSNRLAKPFHQEVISVRNKETARWKKPEWPD